MSAAVAKLKAKELGIKIGKMKTDEIIRTIQSKEGNIPCFHSGVTQCDQSECLWKKSCMPPLGNRYQ